MPSGYLQSLLIHQTVYHGYWAMDITQVNPHFGSEDNLKQLVAECHRRDIWVMLDV